MSGPHDNPRTLGGLRPGTVVSLPGRPDTQWRDCPVRTWNEASSHVTFLDDLDSSIYCFECRKRKPTYVRTKNGVPVGRTPDAPAFKPRDLADWNEFWTERAAVHEHLGGLSRTESERLASEAAGPSPR